MIAEPDRESRNPQTLPASRCRERRKSSRPITRSTRSPETYLRKFPNTALNFQLGDFLSDPDHGAKYARLVTGFGKIFDLSGEDLSGVVLPDT